MDSEHDDVVTLPGGLYKVNTLTYIQTNVVTRYQRRVQRLPAISNDKKEVVKAVSENAVNIHKSWCGDEDVIRAAVLSKINPWKLFRASETSRNDKRFVLSAVRRDGSNLQFASTQMQSDRDVVMTAVTSFGMSL